MTVERALFPMRRNQGSLGQQRTPDTGSKQEPGVTPGEECPFLQQGHVQRQMGQKDPVTGEKGLLGVTTGQLEEEERNAGGEKWMIKRECEIRAIKRKGKGEC